MANGNDQQTLNLRPAPVQVELWTIPRILMMLAWAVVIVGATVFSMNAIQTERVQTQNERIGNQNHLISGFVASLQQKLDAQAAEVRSALAIMNATNSRIEVLAGKLEELRVQQALMSNIVTMLDSLRERVKVNEDAIRAKRQRVDELTFRVQVLEKQR